MQELQIEWLPIEELQTYENNAKIHTGEQIEQIKKSIEEFGFNDPIAVWKNNVIIEGHGRLIAATELGLEKVPVIRLDHLTDEQRKAYTLVHNRLTMNTGFDIDMLDAELGELGDFNMEQFGFDSIVFDDNGVADGGTETGTSFKYSEQYGVIVVCDNEAEQEDVYNKLAGEGYNCKVVAV